MTQLRFSGLVECEKCNPVSVKIGGRSVLDEVEETFQGTHHVTVALADERFMGELDCDVGSEGYSEYTPGESAILRAGDHDVLDRLEELDGNEVTLWIADEPVNVMDVDLTKVFVCASRARAESVVWTGHNLREVSALGAVQVVGSMLHDKAPLRVLCTGPGGSKVVRIPPGHFLVRTGVVLVTMSRDEFALHYDVVRQRWA